MIEKLYLNFKVMQAQIWKVECHVCIRREDCNLPDPYLIKTKYNTLIILNPVYIAGRVDWRLLSRIRDLFMPLFSQPGFSDRTRVQHGITTAYHH